MCSHILLIASSYKTSNTPRKFFIACLLIKLKSGICLKRLEDFRWSLSQMSQVLHSCKSLWFKVSCFIVLIVTFHVESSCTIVSPLGLLEGWGFPPGMVESCQISIIFMGLLALRMLWNIRRRRILYEFDLRNHWTHRQLEEELIQCSMAVEGRKNPQILWYWQKWNKILHRL